MDIARKGRDKSEHRKLLGVKVSRTLIKELRQYAEFVGQPINYCAEKLMEYGLSQDHEFQNETRSPGRLPHGSEKGWDAFVTMGKTAVPGKVADASFRHDRYLYGGRTKK